MRPGDFSPGNWGRRSWRRAAGSSYCFNEAGGFLPRKRETRRFDLSAVLGASMRPGDFSPGNQRRPGHGRTGRAGCFNEAGGFLPRKLIWGAQVIVISTQLQ